MGASRLVPCPECGQLLLQLLLPATPPPPAAAPLLHLCVSCCGHSVSMSCLPAVCVFRMFLALLNALLFDQSPDRPAVGRSDCPTDRLATRQVVQLAVGLAVGLIDCPA